MTNAFGLSLAALEQRGDRDRQESSILEYLNTAISLEPENLLAHQRRALLCARTGQHLGLGIASAQTVLAAAPNEASLELSLAFMKYNQDGRIELSPRIRAIAVAGHDHTPEGRQQIRNARELIRLESIRMKSAPAE